MVCISVFSCDSHTNPADRINPCFQRLTYEEKMARRLLGADNAATVLNSQETEEEPVTQVRWLFFRIHTPGRGNHTHTHSPEIIQARKHLTNMSTPAAFTLFFNPTVACKQHSISVLFSVESSDTLLVSYLSHDCWLSFIYRWIWEHPPAPGPVNTRGASYESGV